MLYRFANASAEITARYLASFWVAIPTHLATSIHGDRPRYPTTPMYPRRSLPNRRLTPSHEKLYIPSLAHMFYYADIITWVSRKNNNVTRNLRLDDVVG